MESGDRDPSIHLLVLGCMCPCLPCFAWGGFVLTWTVVFPPPVSLPWTIACVHVLQGSNQNEADL